MTESDLQEIKTSLRRLEDKLDGYLLGEKGKHNGLLGRMTRLETIEEHRRWHIRAVWTALIGLAGKFLVDLFRRTG